MISTHHGRLHEQNQEANAELTPVTSCSSPSAAVVSAVRGPFSTKIQKGSTLRRDVLSVRNRRIECARLCDLGARRPLVCTTVAGVISHTGQMALSAGAGGRDRSGVSS